MAARPLWKGHLRISLVTVPVRVYPATNAAATVSFHQLHSKCNTRIQYKKWCPHCEREVSNDEIVKGYEFERGRYVALTAKEIASVRPESTRVIDLRQFSTADAIDPMLLDEPYYLAPDGKVAAESFVVLRDALKGKAGVGTVAMHGRERLVAVEPRDAILVMFTLRHENEIRQPDSIEETHDLSRKVRPEEVALAKKVIGEFESTIDFSKYHDTYEDALRKMIEAKIRGEEVIATEEEAPPKVVNLMDALRKSLDQVGKGKKRPAKAPAPAAKRAARVTRFPKRKGA
jgi:DNA end-binding protein Ku